MAGGDAAPPNSKGRAALNVLLEGIAKKYIPRPAGANSQGVRNALDEAFWAGAKVGVVAVVKPKKD
jgi:hypothetical protein